MFFAEICKERVMHSHPPFYDKSARDAIDILDRVMYKLENERFEWLHDKYIDRFPPGEPRQILKDLRWMKDDYFIRAKNDIMDIK